MPLLVHLRETATLGSVLWRYGTRAPPRPPERDTRHRVKQKRVKQTRGAPRPPRLRRAPSFARGRPRCLSGGPQGPSRALLPEGPFCPISDHGLPALTKSADGAAPSRRRHEPAPCRQTGDTRVRARRRHGQLWEALCAPPPPASSSSSFTAPAASPAPLACLEKRAASLHAPRTVNERALC